MADITQLSDSDLQKLHSNLVANAILGQESGNNPAAPTSVDGAVGQGQIMPATFARYAQPGEDIVKDSGTVSKRIVDDYSGKYDGDPARIAVAYFSGEGNVAPPGSSTPWKNDVADGNGKTVSSYVGDVTKRLGADTAAVAPVSSPQDIRKLSDTELNDIYYSLPLADRTKTGFSPPPPPNNSPMFGKYQDEVKQASLGGMAKLAGVFDKSAWNGDELSALPDRSAQTDQAIEEAKTGSLLGVSRLVLNRFNDAMKATPPGKLVGGALGVATAGLAPVYNAAAKGLENIGVAPDIIEAAGNAAPLLGAFKSGKIVENETGSGTPLSGEVPPPPPLGSLPSESPPGLKTTDSGQPLIISPRQTAKGSGIVVDTLNDEGITSTDLLAAADRLEKTQSHNPDKTMLDALTETPGTGRGLVQLFSAAANRPGQGAKMAADMIKRGDLSADQIGGLFDKTVSNTPYSTVKQGAIQAQEGTGDLYQQAYKANPSMMTPEINTILNTPAGKAALSDAARTMQNSRSQVGVSNPDLVEQAALTGTDVPRGGISSGLKMRTLTLVKQELWDMAQKERDPQTYKYTSNGRAILDSYNKLNDEMIANDATRQPGQPDSGLFAQANKTYSTAARQREALESGRNFHNMDAEEIQNYIGNKNISDPEKAAFLAGARRQIKAIAGSKQPGQNPIVRLNTVNMRDRYNAMLGADKSQQLIQGLNEHAHMHDINNVAAGSQTFGRQAFNEKIEGDTTLGKKAYNTINMADPFHAAGKVAEYAIDKKFQKMSQGMSNDRAAIIVRILTSKDPATLRYLATQVKK